MSNDLLLCINGRPPEWRWERAKQLARENLSRKKMLFHKKDDDAVRELAQYIRDVDTEVSGVPLLEVCKRNIPLRMAAMIRLDNTSSSRKHVLEAVMLADDMTDERAARLAAVRIDVAKWYLDCFFDLREKEDKERYISSMHLRMRSYSHRMFESVGYKHMVAEGGLETFERLILRRKPTKEDRKWLETDEQALKSLYTWSRTWESMGDEPINPLELQRREMMNPRKVDSERPKGSGEDNMDWQEMLEIPFSMKPMPVMAIRRNTEDS